MVCDQPRTSLPAPPSRIGVRLTSTTTSPMFARARMAASTLSPASAPVPGLPRTSCATEPTALARIASLVAASPPQGCRSSDTLNEPPMPTSESCTVSTCTGSTTAADVRMRCTSSVPACEAVTVASTMPPGVSSASTSIKPTTSPTLMGVSSCSSSGASPAGGTKSCGAVLTAPMSRSTTTDAHRAPPPSSPLLPSSSTCIVSWSAPAKSSSGVYVTIRSARFTSAARPRKATTRSLLPRPTPVRLPAADSNANDRPSRLASARRPCETARRTAKTPTGPMSTSSMRMPSTTTSMAMSSPSGFAGVSSGREITGGSLTDVTSTDTLRVVAVGPCGSPNSPRSLTVIVIVAVPDQSRGGTYTSPASAALTTLMVPRATTTLLCDSMNSSAAASVSATSGSTRSDGRQAHARSSSHASSSNQRCTPSAPTRAPTPRWSMSALPMAYKPTASSRATAPTDADSATSTLPSRSALWSTSESTTRMPASISGVSSATVTVGAATTTVGASLRGCSSSRTVAVEATGRVPPRMSTSPASMASARSAAAHASSLR
mmetsp:Transcript_17321/g.60907  ORF Transcript_17321/g.60907 Transcript_17321/m.60907 type:complete len:549 (-) Transcript_17321:1369-3015(-)